VTERQRSARDLRWFFLLALGSTAVLHGAISLLGLGFSLSPDSPALPLYLLGLATPAAAALVVSGRTGRGAFLRGVLRPRGSWRLHASVFLLQPAILATAWLLSGSSSETTSIRLSVSSGFPLLALGQIWVVLGEELGWRGFALPRLEELLSPRSATLVLALAWGAWHAPMFFVSGSLQAREPVWLFCAAVFAWSCVHTAIHHSARPSVVPNLLFHGFANLALNLVLVPAPARSELAAVYAVAGVLVWLSLGRPALVEAERSG
jgi:membrane protease YdiL (CAAX protease family)